MVRLDGITEPCLLLCDPDDELPEELVVDFGKAALGGSRSDLPQGGPVTYRLEPSGSHDPQPIYRELFEE